MSARARILLGGVALLGPLAAYPTLARPQLGIAFVLGALVSYLAFRSVAYPIALWSLPGVVIALIGTNPFPNDSVELFLVGWLVFALLLALLREENALPLRLLLAPPMLVTLGLAVLMLARLGDSGAASYGDHKLQLFLAENVTFVVAGVLIARRREHIGVWTWGMLASVSVGALVLVRGLVAGGLEEALPGRLALYEQAGPIALARGAATGLLLAVFVLLTSGAPWRRMLALALVPALGVAFIGAGSRGPVLGLVVGLAVLLALTVGERVNRRRLLLLALSAAIAVVVIPQLVPGQNVARSLSVLIGGGEDVGGGIDANGRLVQWQTAWDAFADHPLLGIGTGSFARLDPDGIYPHNILLEAASELGILGLTFVVALLAFAFWHVARAWRRAEGIDRTHAALVAAFLGAGVTNALFSGDLTNNSALWLGAGLALGLMQRVVPDAERETWQRVRTRWHRHGGGVPEPLAGQRRLPPVGRGGAGGVIASPVDGSTLRGQIRISAVPAGAGWAVGTVVVECSPDGREWQEVAVAEAEDDYEVYVVTRRGAERRRQVAVVRSLPRAEEMRAALESEYGEELEHVELRPSRKRAWNARDVREAVWDTTKVEDGTYLLRAVTLDVTGRAVSSGEVSVTVDNTPPVVQIESPLPNAVLMGVVEVASAARDPVSGIARVRIEAARVDGEWNEIGTLREAPFKTSWSTAQLGEGDYRLRAVAFDQAGNEAESRPVVVRVERLVTVIKLEDPGERLSRVVRLRAALHDEARVKAVEFQIAPADSFAWRALASVEHAPFALDLDTARLGDGVYDLRAVALAKDGSIDASRVLRRRIVDNVPPSVAMAEPADGMTVRGSVPLSARASDEGAGVHAVLFQFSSDGKTWRPVVTRADNGNSISWDTARLADGRYRLRAVAGDAAANLTPSEPIEVLVDNTPPALALESPAAEAQIEGMVGVRARAHDAGSGVLSVRYELSEEGERWRELATTGEAPYGIRWDTLALDDGEYGLRCIARDRAGNVTTSAPTLVEVVNHPAPPPPPEPEPDPEPEPEPPPPPPPPAPAPAPPPPPESVGGLSLWQLERLLAVHGTGHALHDELEALLYTLRSYARPDGSIPERFRPLVEESFGELLS